MLVKRKWPPEEGKWALPGGHLNDGELGEDAATRELREEAGVVVRSGITSDYLRKIDFYEGPGRVPGKNNVATFGYLGLCGSARKPVAQDDAEAARWMDVKGVLARDELAFDHGAILRDGLESLRRLEDLKEDRVPLWARQPWVKRIRQAVLDLRLESQEPVESRSIATPARRVNLLGRRMGTRDPYRGTQSGR